jgi:hypothetical protein
MRNHKKALLSTAILAAITAGSAQAGTESCFEVYKGANDLATIAFDTVYGGAACIAEADRVAGGAADLEPTNEAAIAYELTGALNVDFDAVDGVNTDQYIVYIPTTDIPGGTLIEMQLSGAVFNGNGNQIHMVKYDTDAADGSFEAVASSDGALDGTNSVTFLTKAGVTIGAGTRLVLSRVSTGANDAALDPIGIRIENTTCTSASSSQQVTIRATSAITDGGTGFSIAGGVSGAQSIVDISPQFWTFNGGSTAEVEVNAESSDSAGAAIVARTEFVYEAADATDQLIAKQYEAVYKTAFYNREPNLDQFITLDADDHLETSFITSADPGTDVEMGIWNGRAAATGVLSDQEVVETGTTWGEFGLTKAAATVYNTEAVDVFTPAVGAGDAEPNPALAASTLFGADHNNLYYVVTNRVTDSIMNFNYQVTTDYTLDFGTAGELDHCNANINTHDIGVNGAVLKVPYAVNGSGNFVRVTNEHTESAEVTVDVFGESADGTAANRKATAVTLGTVPAQSSVVYFVPDVIAEAVSQQGYLGADGGYAQGAFGSNANSVASRHTLTFTVTAPRDSVHGVTVQKITGGVDRVMTVLDQNVWTQ